MCSQQRTLSNWIGLIVIEQATTVGRFRYKKWNGGNNGLSVRTDAGTDIYISITGPRNVRRHSLGLTLNRALKLCLKETGD